MEKGKLNRIIIILITATAASVFVATLMRAAFYAPEEEVPLPQNIVPVATTTSVLPARLIIPLLKIDSNIQHVGVTATGNMAAPTGFSDVGWYKYGTVPGNLGTAVLAGHVDNGLALPGVFKNLKDLKPGDDVYSVDKEGNRLHFVVESVESFDYENVPLDRLFNEKDVARLNLITCDGTWIPGKKTYDKRIVVFATYKSGEAGV